MVEKVKTKKYRYIFFAQLVGIILFLICVFGLFFVLRGRNQLDLETFTIALIVLICLSCAMVYSSIQIFLFYSTIGISESGISAHKIGFRIRFIKWEDITKIKKEVFMNPSSWKRSERFFVFDKSKETFGTLLANTLSNHIIFAFNIHHYSDLVEQINHYADEYGIPRYLVDRTKGKEEKLVSKF